MIIARIGTMLLGLAFGAGVRIQAAEPNQVGQSGFYLVLADGPAADALPAPTSRQQVLRYDYKFLRPEEKEDTKYLLLAKRPDVPLFLRKPPEKEIGDGGRTQLLLEVTDDAGRDVEKLTREHLGQQVAFVMDGEVVSTHTIRSVITDGKFRMSRCTDNACEYIYGRLMKAP